MVKSTIIFSFFIDFEFSFCLNVPAKFNLRKLGVSVHMCKIETKNTAIILPQTYTFVLGREDTEWNDRWPFNLLNACVISIIWPVRQLLLVCKLSVKSGLKVLGGVQGNYYYYFLLSATVLNVWPERLDTGLPLPCLFPLPIADSRCT